MPKRSAGAQAGSVESEDPKRSKPRGIPHFQSLDVAASVAPRALVGRRVKVPFEGGACYAGRVAAYDPETHEHKIVYDDGDEEKSLLCKDKMLMLWIDPSEPLPPPTRGELLAQAGALWQAAERQQAAAAAAQAQAAGGARRALRADPKQQQAEREALAWLARAGELMDLAEDLPEGGGGAGEGGSSPLKGSPAGAGRRGGAEAAKDEGTPSRAGRTPTRGQQQKEQQVQKGKGSKQQQQQQEKEQQQQQKAQKEEKVKGSKKQQQQEQQKEEEKAVGSPRMPTRGTPQKAPPAKVDKQQQQEQRQLEQSAPAAPAVASPRLATRGTPAKADKGPTASKAQPEASTSTAPLEHAGSSDPAAAAPSVAGSKSEASTPASAGQQGTTARKRGRAPEQQPLALAAANAAGVTPGGTPATQDPSSSKRGRPAAADAAAAAAAATATVAQASPAARGDSPSSVISPAGQAPAAAASTGKRAAAASAALTPLAAAVEAARAVADASLDSLREGLPCDEEAVEVLLRKGSFISHVANVPGLEPTHVVWAPRALPKPPASPTPDQSYAIENMKTRLAEARAAFVAACEGDGAGLQFREMDVAARIDPASLVGRSLRIYWEHDDAWFLGEVTAWDPVTAQHTLRYQDGELGAVWVGAERVRLAIFAAQDLPSPSPDTLRRLAASYARWGAAVAAWRAGRRGKGAAAGDGSDAYAVPGSDAWVASGFGYGSDDRDVPALMKARAAALTARAALLERGQVNDIWDASGAVQQQQQHKGRRSGGGARRGNAGRGQKRGRSGQQEKGGAEEAGDADMAMGTSGCDPEAKESADGVLRPHNGAAPAPSESVGGGGKGMTPAATPTSLAPPPVPQQQQGEEETEQQQQQRGDEEMQEAEQLDAEQQQQEAAADSQAPGQQQETGGAVAGAAAGAASAAAPPQPLVPMRPGEVVWVALKGEPVWPALVITTEEADDFRRPRKDPRVPMVPVHYFGLGGQEHGRERVALTNLMPWETALEAAVFAGPMMAKRSKNSAGYVIGLAELISYMRDGELPSHMCPEHNDERWYDDDEGEDGETDQTADQGAAKGKKAAKGPAALGPGGVRLPMSLGGGLKVVSLGTIEWLNRAFHTEKYIWPVGYKALRMARTPAGGEVWHTLEVLSQNGTPVFRVTPEGGRPVEGDTPTNAWAVLFGEVPGSGTAASGKGGGAKNAAAAAAAAARAAGRSGPLIFGLQHPRVRALLQQLPGAVRLERLVAWEGGERPEVPPLTPEEELQRLAVEASAQRLPPGIRALPFTRHLAGVCDVCGTETEYDGDWLVECDKCRLLVHMGCYGVKQHPAGAPWQCDVCRLPGLDNPPACVLCPRMGGAMKLTRDGRWCHLLCATWMPGVAPEDSERMEPIVGTDKLPRSRLELTCGVCKQRYGACIQCGGSNKCYSAFHVTCARDAGYKMVVQGGDDGGEEEEEEEEGQDTGAVGDDTGSNPGGQQQQQQQRGKGKGGKKKGGGRKGKGNSAGGLCSLLCFCPKHRGAQPPGGKMAPIHASNTGAAVPTPPRAAAAAAAAVCGGARAAAVGAPLPFGLTSAGQPQQGNQQQQLSGCAGSGAIAARGGQQQAVLSPGRAAALAAAAAYRVPPGTCARSRAADAALRRGLRAPEALDAALRKRLYVQRLPYLVTHRPPREGRPLLPPPPRGARFEGPEFEADAAARLAAGPDAATTPFPVAAPPAAAAVASGSTSAAIAARQGDGGRLLSQAERFVRMVATTRDRVAIGKSAIHGWGAFAKVPHRAGDMVVEYAGALVRPAVADVLERRHYNSVVGAGTYIFRLNEDMCIDATVAGSVAHLLNHSCAPCCHSRTITVTHPVTGERRDHVVIYASRDIGVGEELTYDYRFAGEERLPCNCGAATCRGMVNAPADDEGGGVLRVRRRDLQPVGADAAATL